MTRFGFVVLLVTMTLFATGCESDADRLMTQLDELEEAEEYEEALELIDEELRSGSFSSVELQLIERREEQLEEKANAPHPEVQNISVSDGYDP